MSLLPCTSCRRHVRERIACPFCGALLGLLAMTLVPELAHAETPEPPRPEPPEYSVHPMYGVPPEPESPRANAVQADLGLGVVGIGYERVLHEKVALQLSAHVFGTWWGPTFDWPNFTGFGGQIRPTFFVTDDAPRGVYLAPFFRAERVSAKANDVTGHGFGFSAGGFVGYSFMLGHAVNLRIGGGAQYMSYAVDAGDVRLEWKRIHPALDLLLGYTF